VGAADSGRSGASRGPRAPEVSAGHRRCCPTDSRPGGHRSGAAAARQERQTDRRAAGDRETEGGRPGLAAGQSGAGDRARRNTVMASLVFEQDTSKAPATPTTVGVAIAAPELWEPVQDALRGLAVRVVIEQRDLRNWPSLIERLEFLRPEVVLLDITGLPLPLEEAVRAVRAALPDAMLVALDTTAQPETILAAMRVGANEFL